MSRTGEEGYDEPHPGPIYDVAIRTVLEGDPAAACRLLGIPVSKDREFPVVLSSSFAKPKGALNADLVMRVGADRLAHVECERRLSAEEMVARMMGYRGAIQRRFRKKVLTQHLLVLGGGRVHPFVDPLLTWFWGWLGVTFMRDLDPEPLLSSPALAPLAALCRGSTQARAAALKRALVVIRRDGGERAEDLYTCATTLAEISLDSWLVEKIAGEVSMDPEEFQIVKDHVARRHERYLRQNEFERRLALEQDRVNGIAELLAPMITKRFGPHPENLALARRLATRPDRGEVAEAVLSAATLAELAATAKMRLPSP